VTLQLAPKYLNRAGKKGGDKRKREREKERERERENAPYISYTVVT